MKLPRRRALGSARASRAGDGASPSRTFSTMLHDPHRQRGRFGGAPKRAREARALPRGTAQRRLVSHLSRPANDVLVGRQFLETHRTAGMKFIRADSDLRAETEFTAIRETGGGIPIDGRGIHLAQKLFRCRFVTRDDAIAVMRTELSDVRDGLVRRINHPESENEIEVFRRPIGFRGVTKRLIIQAP